MPYNLASPNGIAEPVDLTDLNGWFTRVLSQVPSASERHVLERVAADLDSFVPGRLKPYWKHYPRSLADGRDLLSGMIFFNEQGDEVGGLIYNGIKKDSGYSALGHLSFDQWKQNQVVANYPTAEFRK